MISAIAGLSALGGSLSLAKAGMIRASDYRIDPVSGRETDAVKGLPPVGVFGATGKDRQSAESGLYGGRPVADTVEISPEGLAAARRVQQAKESEAAGPTRAFEELSEEEQKQVAELRQRDAEVRAHEAAHRAAGGQHAGGVSYTFQTGPDGKRYAVGGEVPIDVSPVKGDPEATIRKMQQVRQAALAPAQPSSADRQVAAKAAQLEQKARAELAEQSRNADDAEPAEEGDFAIAAFGSTSKSEPPSSLDVYA